MNAPQRFLVAKYMPDASRAEPRNIGVILWASGRAHAQFLPDGDAYFIRDKRTYQRWVTYWQAFLSDGKVSLPRKPVVAIERPEFIDALRETQEGNYMLLEGGRVISAVGRRGLAAATKQLFRDLVLRNAPAPEGPKEQSARLKADCDRALADAGIAARADFQQSYRLPFRVNGVNWPLPFSYAIVNGDLTAAFQRVNVAAQQSINSAAFTYQQLLGNNTLPKERCVTLVRVDPHRPAHGPNPEESMGRLATLSNVINLADATRARDALRRVADAA